MKMNGSVSQVQKYIQKWKRYEAWRKNNHLLTLFQIHYLESKTYYNIEEGIKTHYFRVRAANYD